MTLPRVEGHEDARASLAAAVAARQLPNSLLLHGPAGIGKQRVALWLGQLLLCEAPRETGPCDTCRACRLALRLEHPDLHWYFPLVRPKGASGERLGDALEEARAAELDARRAEPLRPTVPDGMAGLFLTLVQRLVRAAARRPAMGSRKVFVVGDAEALVPQEASPEAANALLKVLEEPPADTTIILTAADPDVLLPTIRSRMLPVRLQPLSLERVARFLQEHTGADARDADVAARIAQGSIGRALGFLKRDGSDAPLEEIRAAAKQWLEAALAQNAVGSLSAALSTSPAGARGPFSDTLEAFTLWLRDLGAVAAGADDVVVNADALEWLRSEAARNPHVAAGVPHAIREVEATLQLAQFNINPQLALAGLLRGVRRHLSGVRAA